MVSTYTPALRPSDPAFPAVPNPVALADDTLLDSANVPNLNFGNAPVNGSAHTHAGTGLHQTVSYMVGGFVALAFIVGTSGLGLLMLAISPIIEKFRWKKVRAVIRGSGIHVSPEQMPFLHKCVEDFSRRLGLKKVPEVYIVEDSVQNGAAMKLGTKDVILLTDDVIWGALKSNDPRAVAYVLGHEVAHIALGHTKTFRSALSAVYKPLARCDEYTADNVAAALVGDKKIALHGITVLTVGPQLLPYLNEQALEAQAREMWHDKHAKKAERVRSHPLLLRRIANVLSR